MTLIEYSEEWIKEVEMKINIRKTKVMRINNRQNMAAMNQKRQGDNPRRMQRKVF